MTGVRSIGDIVASDLALVSITIRQRVVDARAAAILVYVRDNAIYAVRGDSAAAASIDRRPAQAANEIVGVYTSAMSRRAIEADLIHWRKHAAKEAA